MGEIFQSKDTDCQDGIFLLEKTRSKYSYPQEIHVTFKDRNSLSKKEEKRYIMEIKTIRSMGCLHQYQRKQTLINVTRDKRELL